MFEICVSSCVVISSPLVLPVFFVICSPPPQLSSTFSPPPIPSPPHFCGCFWFELFFVFPPPVTPLLLGKVVARPPGPPTRSNFGRIFRFRGSLTPSPPNRAGVGASDEVVEEFHTWPGLFPFLTSLSSQLLFPVLFPHLEKPESTTISLNCSFTPGRVDPPFLKLCAPSPTSP